MNWKEKAVTLFRQISVSFDWKTIDFNFFHSIMLAFLEGNFKLFQKGKDFSTRLLQKIGVYTLNHLCFGVSKMFRFLQRPVYFASIRGKLVCSLFSRGDNFVNRVIRHILTQGHVCKK